MTPEERTKAELLLIEANKRFYLMENNFFEFCNEVLSYGLPKEKNSIREIPHRELTNFVTRWYKRKKLILLPRGSLKSTIVTQGYSIWRILQNPNIRILIASENLGNAIKYLGSIRSQFEGNMKLREYFGDYVKATQWTESDIIVSKRTMTQLKEPTVGTAGVEMTKVGMHYDLIIVDDPHSQNNTMNAEQINKVIDWYKGLMAIMEPTGQMIVIGTRWHDADLYGNIIENEEEASKGENLGEFDIMIRKSIDDEKLFFPDVLTLPYLESQQNSLGSYMFSMQYQNDPIPQEDAEFKKDYFTYFDSFSIKGRNFNTYMTVDPAISDTQTADYTAIVVVSVDEFNQLYIRDLERGHWKPSEIIDRIFDLDTLYKPRDIGIETTAFQKSLQYSLQDEMRKRGYYLPLREIRPGPTESKELRIRALEPRYRNKSVLHPKPDFRPQITYLEEELLRFPRGKHDDYIDALAMVLKLLSPAHRRQRHDDEEYYRKKKKKLLYKPRSRITGY